MAHPNYIRRISEDHRPKSLCGPTYKTHALGPKASRNTPLSASLIPTVNSVLVAVPSYHCCVVENWISFDG